MRGLVPVVCVATAGFATGFEAPVKLKPDRGFHLRQLGISIPSETLVRQFVVGEAAMYFLLAPAVSHRAATPAAVVWTDLEGRLRGHFEVPGSQAVGMILEGGGIGVVLRDAAGAQKICHFDASGRMIATEALEGEWLKISTRSGRRFGILPGGDAVRITRAAPGGRDLIPDVVATRRAGNARRVPAFSVLSEPLDGDRLAVIDRTSAELRLLDFRSLAFRTVPLTSSDVELCRQRYLEQSSRLRNQLGPEARLAENVLVLSADADDQGALWLLFSPVVRTEGARVARFTADGTLQGAFRCELVIPGQPSFVLNPYWIRVAGNRLYLAGVDGAVASFVIGRN